MYMLPAVVMSKPVLTQSHITAWARLVRVSTHVLQAIETGLKDEGLPPLSWYDLLLELDRIKPEGLRPFQLQTEMLIPQYNMSRLLDRIEKAGHIHRQSCDEDGRGQIIHISPSGETLLKRMWPVYRRVLETQIGERFSEKDAVKLSDLLDI
jgi:DNA-binding MarR family transcriptional regulator